MSNVSETNNHTTKEAVSETEVVDVYEVRKQKLDALRAGGFDFPNVFRRTHLIADIAAAHAGDSKEVLAEKAVKVAIAGRVVLRRVMGSTRRQFVAFNEITASDAR
jgi:lysyl-tRNA synthetase class 2